jgi:hypothetical protein
VHIPHLVETVGTRAIEAVGLRDACDLDLLLFFSRHPHVVLSSEQLAAYAGYQLQQVARSLDLLIGTGLLRRSINQGVPGRMYVLEIDQTSGEWLEALRRVCEAPAGRNALRALLRQRRPRASTPNGSARPPSGRERVPQLGGVGERR